MVCTRNPCCFTDAPITVRQSHEPVKEIASRQQRVVLGIGEEEMSWGIARQPGCTGGHSRAAELLFGRFHANQPACEAS
jgi:hypothetical protein